MSEQQASPGVAVHFGAGNIGRGFIGLVLHDAGYEVVFADVADALIEQLQAADSYTVHEVGPNARDLTVTGFRALNSGSERDAVVAEIASAAIVTTAVGPNVLRFVAPVIADGLRQRAGDLPALAVMACENAIGATDTLRREIEQVLDETERSRVLGRAVFANTAVDRIVPAQAPDAGIDVTVEDFFEWAIEESPFEGAPPVIPEAHFVPDLAPYIERKLFTVNTGHATLAYHGFRAGATDLADALSRPEVRAEVEAVLAETKALLVAKHDFEPDEQERYLRTNIERFGNPQLTDTVARVGRAPVRKLSRHERFIGPAAELAERGMRTDALLGAVRAALAFDVPGDPESVALQALLRSEESDAELATRITGLEPAHPLFDGVVAAVAGARDDLRA